ncbi:DUF4340 domain-containing protein [Fulvivirga lutea]|uniref:DUF4340 domain-containing protein n=1 Tax=Fulvivirga lutea TaxID=2810512 RepID=A0A974WLN3_9BACT|nr:DUF4340 domain-containing protein [Fulvivirga lutea]QSE98510.1 DUF4340 domain-containing protein [Fulvivirga lutea]
MSKNKILLIVFGVLLAIYFGNKFLGSNNDRNFRDVLVELDTASVNKVVIEARANSHQPVEFIKEGGKWSVSNGAKKDDADKNSVKSIINSLIKLEPQRLVSNSEDKWAQYEVNDSLGTKVKMYAGDKELANLVVGKFNFNQQARTAATFVRLADEEEVYTVDGFLASTYNQEFNSFRDKTFVKTTPENLTSLKFDYAGDSSFVLNKVSDATTGSVWQVNGVEADSASVQKYLNGLRRLNQSDFADDFTPSEGAAYTLTIDGNNMNSIVVKGFMRDDEVILNSSLNSDAYFKKGSLNVFEKLFVSSQSFTSN